MGIGIQLICIFHFKYYNEPNYVQKPSIYDSLQTNDITLYPLLIILKMLNNEEDLLFISNVITYI